MKKYLKITEQPSSIWDTGFSSWRLLSATTRLDEVATEVLSLLLLDSGKQNEGKIVSNKTVFRRRSECIREKVISRFLLKSRQRVGSQLRAIRGQNTQLNLNVPSPTSVTLAPLTVLMLILWKHLYQQKLAWPSPRWSPCSRARLAIGIYFHAYEVADSSVWTTW